MLLLLLLFFCCFYYICLLVHYIDLRYSRSKSIITLNIHKKHVQNRKCDTNRNILAVRVSDFKVSWTKRFLTDHQNLFLFVWKVLEMQKHELLCNLFLEQGICYIYSIYAGSWVVNKWIIAGLWYKTHTALLIVKFILYLPFWRGILLDKNNSLSHRHEVLLDEQICFFQYVFMI